MKPKRAFLLAAGLGTRLKPLTDTTPKCLLPVGGKPILHWWLKTAESLGIEEVLINTHHLSEKVEAFIDGERYDLKVLLVHEEALLGSAGTLAVNKDFISEGPFWVFYADTLIDADLSVLLPRHERAGVPLTMGLFTPPDPRLCGVVELDESGLIVSFEEKPAHPKSQLANAGVYLAEAKVLDRLPAGEPPPGGWDIGKDLIPRFIPGSLGVPLNGVVIDIGTAANYDEAKARWDSLGISKRFAAK